MIFIGMHACNKEPEWNASQTNSVPGAVAAVVAPVEENLGVKCKCTYTNNS